MTRIPPPKAITDTPAGRALARLADAERLYIDTLRQGGDPTEAMLQISEAKRASEAMLRKEGMIPDGPQSMEQVGQALVWLGKDQTVGG